ncbi:MAG: 2-C-methyl-D-erythritol 4-phosphate cytidylyltransferase [Verrucomicrobiota bacterium]|nr:2-C-methyl-D-erythritol 4-phosphate cytidylyltransferase [Verrucomicrobiota bacterium]
MTNAAILLAAGRGTRMRSLVDDKILAPLAGEPVFAHSVRAFLLSGVVDGLVVVFRDEEQRVELSRILAGLHADAVTVLWVQGGEERRDSVYHGLLALPATVQLVFIHDCARPLIKPAWLHLLATAAKRTGAVSLAHPVTDTIKESAATANTASGETACGPWHNLDRTRLWALETPQVFTRTAILEAYELARKSGVAITDDTSAITLAGYPLELLHTPGPNLKLTQPADFILAEALIRNEAGLIQPSP